MFDLHDQVADLRLQLLVLGFQLALLSGRLVCQSADVAAILFSPPFDQASRNLILACGLGHRYLPGLDLFDHLAFEFGFELSTDFSHFEYRCPLRPAQKRLAREALIPLVSGRRSMPIILY